MSAIHPNPTTEPLVASSSSAIKLHFPNPSGCPEHEGLIAVITLNAPVELNSMRLRDTQELMDTLQWVAAQPRVVATVLTGAGRFFSAGANFKDTARDLPEAAQRLPEGSAERILESKLLTLRNAGSTNIVLLEALHHHPKLLVGAMNGPAVGIYATMLAHCDLLYTYDDFFLQVPFMSLGLVSEGGAAISFAKTMGIGRAKQALLGGKKMTALELQQVGFITQTFPKPARPEDLSSDAVKLYTPPILPTVLDLLTARFLEPAADPFALLYTKKLIRAASYDGWDLSKTLIEELKGTESVFTSGRPQKQIQRLRQAAKARDKAKAQLSAKL